MINQKQKDDLTRQSDFRRWWPAYVVVALSLVSAIVLLYVFSNHFA